jgi:hypothetical protein
MLALMSTYFELPIPTCRLCFKQLAVVLELLSLTCRLCFKQKAMEAELLAEENKAKDKGGSKKKKSKSKSKKSAQEIPAGNVRFDPCFECDSCHPDADDETAGGWRRV